MAKLLEGLRVGEETQRKVMGGNAAKLYRI